MAKYTFAYRGGGTPETPEEGERVMAAWTSWYGSLGAAISDGGAPFGPSASVSPGGAVASGAPSGLSGFTVVSADSLAAASEMARGCPVLDAGGSVDVYECIDLQM